MRTARKAGSKGTVPGLAARLGEVAGIGVLVAGIGVLVAEDPLRCVVRGAAAMLTAGGAPGIPVR
jgi:hypothetical protein